MENKSPHVDYEGAARYIAELGLPLPEGSTWTDINAYRTAESAAQRATELGLPEGSTWADIGVYENAKSAARYIKEHNLPLPESSSWGDISRFKSKRV